MNGLLTKVMLLFDALSDATEPRRVVVPLDLEQDEFLQVLRDTFPDLHAQQSFQLCRVSGQRLVIPLNLNTMCPSEIHRNNALRRSNLYIRPQVGKYV